MRDNKELEYNIKVLLPFSLGASSPQVSSMTGMTVS